MFSCSNSGKLKSEEMADCKEQDKIEDLVLFYNRPDLLLAHKKPLPKLGESRLEQTGLQYTLPSAIAHFCLPKLYGFHIFLEINAGRNGRKDRIFSSLQDSGEVPVRKISARRSMDDSFQSLLGRTGKPF